MLWSIRETEVDNSEMEIQQEFWKHLQGGWYNELQT